VPPLTSTSDIDLLRAWRAGDRAAGGVLLRRYFDGILRFFRNKVDHGAEDLVQQTFAACVEGRDRFREEAPFRAYLFAIAHNILCEYVRDRWRSREYLDLDKLSIVDLGASPTARLAARGDEWLLLNALRQIPLASQVILELYYWERMTGPELGLSMGLPENTARSRLRKAKKQLEKTMSELACSPAPLDSSISDLEQWAARLRGQFAPPR